MNSRLGFALSTATVMLALFTLPAAAQEQFTFTDFTSLTNLITNGSPAAPVSVNVTIHNGSENPPTGNVLRLTPAVGDYAASVWYSVPNTPAGQIAIGNGFTTNFSFQFTGPSSPPADGIAFVIQNKGTAALGDYGGALGYGPLYPASPGGNAFPSLAVEFDDYRNSEYSDPFTFVPHVAVQSCGGTVVNNTNHGDVACNLGMSSLFSTPIANGTNGTFDGGVPTGIPTLPGLPLSDGQQGAELYFLSGGVYDLGSLGSSNSAFFTDNPLQYGAFANPTPYIVAPISTNATPNFDDGNVHNVTINYVVPSNCGEVCPTPTLTVIVDTVNVLTTSVNIPSLLNLDSFGDVWVGFTSATGGDWEEHDLVSWNFSSTAMQGTTLPPAPVTQSTPTVTSTFNSASNNMVQQVIDFTGAFATPTNNEPSNPVLTAANQAIAPADWVKYVAGSPFATTTCIPHNGEGGNCKLYIDLCTNDGNAQPAGINCPQSAMNNIVIQDNFDATPKPATPAGTGFGFLMGADNWSTQGQASCVLQGPLMGASCPQDILVNFSGDGSTSSGTTKSLNSTFVSVAGVLMPNTLPSASPVGSYGWTNTATPTLNFASYPPGIGAGTPVPVNNNGYVAAPIASIAYNVNGAVIPPVPISLSPIMNTSGCFGTPATTGGPVPLDAAAEFAPAAVPVVLSQGLNTIQYSATDCAGISELLFNFNAITNSWSTAYKAAAVYVDSVPPSVSCPAADTAWHPGNVTVNCSAGDSGSGLFPVTSTSGGVSYGTASAIIPLSTSVVGAVEITNASTGSTSVTDLAGNGPVAVGPVGPFKIDTKAPLITAVSPALSSTQNYFFNQAVNATYKCSDGGSGVAKCGTGVYSPAVSATGNVVNSINTAVLGQGQHFSVSANDAVGNSTTATLFNYNVSYLFIGFLSLQQPPLMNTFKAGKAMAILFDVQDGKIRAVSGLKLAPAGAVTVSAYSSTNCTGVSPIAVPFSPTLVGLPLGAYSLNWTPPASLAGKCVTVSVGLGDGLTHKANLKF